MLTRSALEVCLVPFPATLFPSYLLPIGGKSSCPGGELAELVVLGGVAMTRKTVQQVK